MNGCSRRAAKAMVSLMRMAFIISFFLTGCADFPALDGTISDAARQAPYPRLTQFPAMPAAIGIDEIALNARVADLRERAAAIRQIDIGALQ